MKATKKKKNLLVHLLSDIQDSLKIIMTQHTRLNLVQQSLQKLKSQSRISEESSKSDVQKTEVSRRFAKIHTGY